MNETEFNAWVATLPLEKQQAIKNQYRRGYGLGQSAGFKSGTAKGAKALLLNKITIPLAVFAFPAGLLIQRYLIVLG